MNNAAEKLFGYQRSEILGGDLNILIPQEYRDKHRKFLDEYLKTGHAHMIGTVAEVMIQRQDGAKIPVSISLSGGVSENGRMLFTAIMRDLSEERSLNQRVQEAEALAAVGKMVATVSHEIKTPLALIGGFTRQVTREPNISEKGRRKLEIVLEEVGRLESLLNEISDLSRPYRYQFEELDMCQESAQVLELMNPSLGEAATGLSLLCNKGVPKVIADKNRLRQVLINLVNNAVQACAKESPQVEVEVSPWPRGGVILEVRDNGHGIPEEHQKELFTPFFTTKKQGTGLGLPLARRIIRDHGGKIKVVSQVGEGTTVLVALPAKPRHGNDS
jgi:PAS domain S-box-containing protein